MFNGDKLIAKIPLSWKKSFNMGVVIPNKMRNCGECKKIFYVKIVRNWLIKRKNFELMLTN